MECLPKSAQSRLGHFPFLITPCDHVSSVSTLKRATSHEREQTLKGSPRNKIMLSRFLPSIHSANIVYFRHQHP